jgi:hypothetical protein
MGQALGGGRREGGPARSDPPGMPGAPGTIRAVDRRVRERRRRHQGGRCVSIREAAQAARHVRLLS